MTDSNADEYRTGFIEGFKSVRAGITEDPKVPSTPTIPAGHKPYDVGWHDGRLHGLDATVPDDPDQV